jgi:hypothetical protein
LDPGIQDTGKSKHKRKDTHLRKGEYDDPVDSNDNHKNEEQILGEPLASVREFADEEISPELQARIKKIKSSEEITP